MDITEKEVLATQSLLNQTSQFSEEELKSALGFAKNAIAYYLKMQEQIMLPSFVLKRAPWNQLMATYVTLTKAGELRGASGSIRAKQSLIESLTDNAFKAAFEDRRFEPMTEPELSELTLEAALLTAPKRMENVQSKDSLIQHIQPNIDGIILADGSKSVNFMPHTWQTESDPETFVNQLMAKAGFKAWTPTMQAHRYQAITTYADWTDLP